jgi:hypothetical protein
VIAVAVLAIVGGVFAWQHFPSDHATKATVGEAVAEFRHNLGGQAGDAGAGEGPQLGVYSYDTKGSESVDTAVLGTSHDYTGISTIALTPAPCGRLERWQVLASRWTEVEICLTPDGFRFKSLAEFHEFFGVAKDTSYECRGVERRDPSTLHVGVSWTSSCDSDKGTATSTVRVAGIEKVKVAAQDYDAIHTVSKSLLKGSIAGTGVREDWRRRSDGLLLRRVVHVDGDFHGTVDAGYKENYSIQLLSTQPQR